jgi:hypothetical protein
MWSSRFLSMLSFMAVTTEPLDLQRLRVVVVVTVQLRPRHAFPAPFTLAGLRDPSVPNRVGQFRTSLVFLGTDDAAPLSSSTPALFRLLRFALFEGSNCGAITRLASPAKAVFGSTVVRELNL